MINQLIDLWHLYNICLSSYLAIYLSVFLSVNLSVFIL